MLETDLHKQIDRLQVFNPTDDIDDYRQKFLSYDKRIRVVDDLQRQIKALASNNQVRQEYRIMYLRDLLRYLGDTEFNVLKSRFNTEVSAYLARLRFFKTMESSNNRKLLDERRNEQDKNFADELLNDDENEINREVQDKINEIEKEFGIDITWETDKLTLQWAEVLQANLRVLKSMPDFRDILELIPEINLRLKLWKKVRASTFLSNFALVFYLDDNLCFSIKTIRHELTHIKSFIYRLNNIEKDKAIQKELTFSSFGESREVKRIINCLNIDRKKDRDILDYINSLSKRELQMIMEYLYLSSFNSFQDSDFIRKSRSLPSLNLFKDKERSYVKEFLKVLTFINKTKQKEIDSMSFDGIDSSLSYFEDLDTVYSEVRGYYSLSDIRGIVRKLISLRQVSSWTSIDVVKVFSSLKSNDITELYSIFHLCSGKLMDSKLVKIFENSSSGWKKLIDRLFDFVVSWRWLNQMFDYSEQKDIIKDRDVVDRVNANTRFIAGNLCINVDIAKIDDDRRAFVVDGYIPIKYINSQEKHNVKMFLLYGIPIKYIKFNNSIELKKSNLEQWVIRWYAKRNYYTGLDKFIINNVNNLNPLKVILYPDLFYSFKVYSEVLIAEIEDKPVSRKRIKYNSFERFLFEIRNILNNPNTPFKPFSSFFNDWFRISWWRLIFGSWDIKGWKFVLDLNTCTLGDVRKLLDKMYILWIDVGSYSWKKFEYASTMSEVYYKDFDDYSRFNYKMRELFKRYPKLKKWDDKQNFPWVDELIKRGIFREE